VNRQIKYKSVTISETVCKNCVHKQNSMKSLKHRIAAKEKNPAYQDVLTCTWWIVFLRHDIAYTNEANKQHIIYDYITTEMKFCENIDKWWGRENIQSDNQLEVPLNVKILSHCHNIYTTCSILFTNTHLVHTMKIIPWL
jgi:hypothetical protein